MASQVYDRLIHEAEALPEEQQLQLIASLAEHLRLTQLSGKERPRWEDLAGSAPFPLCGEDAQSWVSRTRAESDNNRRVP